MSLLLDMDRQYRKVRPASGWNGRRRARLTHILELIFEDNRLNVYAEYEEAAERATA